MRRFPQSGYRSTIRAVMPATVVSSATIREKSRRYCWDSPMIFGSLSFSTFLCPATTKVGLSAATAGLRSQQ